MKQWIAGLAAVALIFGCVGCVAEPVSNPTAGTTTVDTTTQTTEMTTATSLTTTDTTTVTATESTTTTTSGKTTTTTTKTPTTTTTVPLNLPPLVAGSAKSYSILKQQLNVSINAASAVVYDATHDIILYAKNMDSGRAPASITKVLTAIVAVDRVPLDTMFTVGSEQDMVASAASRAFLQRGGRYSLRTLLEAMLIPSGCDAAYTIAVNVARYSSGNWNLTNRQALQLFLRYMNQTAHDIGATNSNFKCPDGFPTSGHYTTARDLLTIARKARTYSSLKNIMSKSVSSNGYWYGTNALIKSYSSYYYKGANGMKTGTSDEAGNCVMASARRDGIDLIVIVLGSGYRYEDAIKLLDKGFAKAVTITTTTSKPTTASTKKPTTATSATNATTSATVTTAPTTVTTVTETTTATTTTSTESITTETQTEE